MDTCKCRSYLNVSKVYKKDLGEVKRRISYQFFELKKVSQKRIYQLIIAQKKYRNYKKK